VAITPDWARNFHSMILYQEVLMISAAECREVVGDMPASRITYSCEFLLTVCILICWPLTLFCFRKEFNFSPFCFCAAL